MCITNNGFEMNGISSPMKKSLFIKSYDAQDGKTYYLQTDKGNMLSVDTQIKENLDDALQNPRKHVGTKLYDKLVEMEFIVPKNRNEIQMISGKWLAKHIAQHNYLELTIMPTEKCNFRCVYCYENFNKPQMSSETEEAIIKFVRKNIKNHKGLIVGWFGGEPLLALSVIERLSNAFIDICKEQKKIYLAAVTTNGYLLDYDLFEKLRHLRINHFQITIDGDRETHDQQRILQTGKGTFDTIVGNLNSILSKAKGNSWSISLRTNITKQIIRNKGRMKKELIEPFDKDPRVSFMLRKMWTNGTEVADALLCDDDEFEKMINDCDISPSSLQSEYLFAYGMNFVCYAGNPNSYVVGSDGSIYKCTYALYDEINQIGYLDSQGEMVLDDQKIGFWTVPSRVGSKDCSECPDYAACVSIGCPYRQNENCKGETLDVLKYFFPQFYRIAPNRADVTHLFP